MPQPTTTDLASLLQPLLEPDQAKELPLLKKRCADPQTLAKELFRRGWLTSFQIKLVFAGRTNELILGQYVLLDRIGKGGYGQIFKARHQRMGRVVAVKMLNHEVLEDQEVVQRFYREIEVASQLSHPQIVHAYEAGPIGGRLVLVMEYVEGRDLEEVVRQQGALPVAQACEYVRQAAVGLQYAHERGLIHRDIKPGNLLVSNAEDSWGTIKILDLGLARLLQPVKGSTTTNLTVVSGQSLMQGSPDYMSPEQALDFHSADIRSDIYSLGCTFYYLLTGSPPFPGKTLAEKLMKHQQAEPPISQLAGVHAEVQNSLRKMLAKRMPDRQQTPREVAEGLQAFCDHETSASTTQVSLAMATESLSPPTLFHRLLHRLKPASSRFQGVLQRRNCWVVAGLAVLLLLSTGGLIWVLSGSLPEETTRPLLPDPLAEADLMLLGRWKFDDGRGDKVPDMTGRGPVAQLVKGPVWMGDTLQFDGKDDYVSIELDEPETNVTHGFWFRTKTDNVGLFSVVDKDLGGSHDRHIFLSQGNLKTRIHSREVIATIGLKLNDGKWHHVAHVFGEAGGGQKLYVDGFERASGKKFKSDFHWQKRINIGYSRDALRDFFQGEIADVRIYKRVLTPDEITHLSKRYPR